MEASVDSAAAPSPVLVGTNVGPSGLTPASAVAEVDEIGAVLSTSSPELNAKLGVGRRG